MSKFVRHLTCCTTLAPLAIAGLAAGQMTYVETFEGSNVGDWTMGNTFERMVADGPDGNPWRYNFNLFTCCPSVATRQNVPSIFTGNYREMGVTSIGIDAAVVAIGWPDCGPGQAGARSTASELFGAAAEVAHPTGRALRNGRSNGGTALSGEGQGIWIMLMTDNGTPDDQEDSWAAYINTNLTDTVPGELGAESFQWMRCDLPIDPAWLEATEVPEGWSILQYGPNSPDEPDWQTLMTNVTQVSYHFVNPGMSHLMNGYRLGVANPRITINPEPGVGDCNGSGSHDAYDIAMGFSVDCNRNGVPDECDLLNGVDTDCTGSGVLDSCLAADAAYVADSGFLNEAIGGSPHDPPGSELIWANRFHAGEGDIIENIAVAFHGSGGLHIGARVEVYLWDDVNNDGSPDDAVLLATASGSVMSLNDFDSLAQVTYDTFTIEPTSVSGNFFVGISADAMSYPAAVDVTYPMEGQSWAATLEPGADATASFQGALSMQQDCMGGVFMIRANGNDANNTGQPDVCDAPLGDLNGDGVVDVSDLLILLGAWGHCPLDNCVGDLNGDWIVDTADLLLLLGNWG